MIHVIPSQQYERIKYKNQEDLNKAFLSKQKEGYVDIANEIESLDFEKTPHSKYIRKIGALELETIEYSNNPSINGKGYRNISDNFKKHVAEKCSNAFNNPNINIKVKDFIQDYEHTPEELKFMDNTVQVGVAIDILKLHALINNPKYDTLAFDANAIINDYKKLLDNAFDNLSPIKAHAHLYSQDFPVLGNKVTATPAEKKIESIPSLANHKFAKFKEEMQDILQSYYKDTSYYYRHFRNSLYTNVFRQYFVDGKYLQKVKLPNNNYPYFEVIKILNPIFNLGNVIVTKRTGSWATQAVSSVKPSLTVKINEGDVDYDLNTILVKIKLYSGAHIINSFNPTVYQGNYSRKEDIKIIKQFISKIAQEENKMEYYNEIKAIMKVQDKELISIIRGIDKDFPFSNEVLVANSVKLSPKILNRKVNIKGLEGMYNFDEFDNTKSFIAKHNLEAPFLKRKENKPISQNLEGLLLAAGGR